MVKEMLHILDDGIGSGGANTANSNGCGPVLQADDAIAKPLKQMVFERVRAVGQAPRVSIAKDLSISPGSVTQISSELIAAGLLEES